MRVKNKEIRQRRHRKEQIIKEAIRQAKAGAGDKPEKAASAEKAAPKKAAAPKPAAEKKPAAKKPAAPKKTEAEAEAPAAEATETPAE